ncbi:hypothetical protein EH165_00525 [Nakamurella antarctica]|uniref:Uncharacterized protein n=1 Tax=Nakamurella antarctica TaxID=1902245 RepID=A0A3G8ZJD7_9ACTN|nr:hypothetical protein [Nakamurella antarctica]AZI56877.1 hypothetical protein EH165_00525 [Nakamurella antarctica]
MRQGTVVDGNVSRYPESHFFDFVVDDQSQLQRFTQGNLVTGLNRPWLLSVSDTVDELTVRRATPGLAAGRVALLVCGECGDLGCGAVTASIRIDDDTVTWTNFLWEDGYSEPSTVTGPSSAMTFNRSDYEGVLRGAYEKVAALPYNELDDRGRKSLWPWQWGR